MSMRAWQLQALGDPWAQLKPADLDCPQPQGDQVLVRVLAADLNFADILQCQGQYQVRLDPPFVPGMSFVGEVIGHGPQSTVRVGDRVAGPSDGPWGGFAQQALMRNKDLYVLPATIDPIAAAAGHITYATAWFGLHVRGQLKPQESVLVLAGAGGVGSAAIQLAKAHGCFVIAAAGGADKVAACQALGADLTVDYNEGDLYQQVMALTDNYGVDVVYDPVGGPFFDQARRLVAWEGRLLVIGFASGAIPQAPANHALVKNYSVVGVHMGGYRDKDPQAVTACYDALYPVLAAHNIKPLMDSVATWSDLPNALHRLAGRKSIGRIVFDPVSGS